MKIAYIADGRAEHARRWIRLITAHDVKVLLLSTYPCQPLDEPNVRTVVLPGIFRPGDTFVKSSENSETEPHSASWVKRMSQGLVKSGLDSLIRPIWHRATTIDVLWQSRAARKQLRNFQPDLTHAFRIPNEGFVLGRTKQHPNVVSVWGQDFVYNCKRYWIHRFLTRRMLTRLDALTADCERDIQLAEEMGLSPQATTRVFPTNAGVDLELFDVGLDHHARDATLIYARGFGPYLRPEVLFAAFSALIAQGMQLKLLIVAPPSQLDFMKSRLESHGIPETSVSLSSFKSRANWARLLKTHSILVSPSVSDGTPNSMLEAMACGAFPVMGDIQSIREWVVHNENGMLFNPDSVDELTNCLVDAAENVSLRQSAMRINRKTIEAKCDRSKVVPAILDFYRDVILETQSGK